MSMISTVSSERIRERNTSQLSSTAETNILDIQPQRLRSQTTQNERTRTLSDVENNREYFVDKLNIVSIKSKNESSHVSTRGWIFDLKDRSIDNLFHDRLFHVIIAPNSNILQSTGTSRVTPNTSQHEDIREHIPELLSTSDKNLSNCNIPNEKHELYNNTYCQNWHIECITCKQIEFFGPDGLFFNNSQACQHMKTTFNWIGKKSHKMNTMGADEKNIEILYSGLDDLSRKKYFDMDVLIYSIYNDPGYLYLSPEEMVSCSICLNDECEAKHSDLKKFVVGKECEHYFHDKCMQQWKKVQKRSKKRSSCPMCRTIWIEPPRTLQLCQIVKDEVNEVEDNEIVQNKRVQTHEIFASTEHTDALMDLNFLENTEQNYNITIPNHSFRNEFRNTENIPHINNRTSPLLINRSDPLPINNNILNRTTSHISSNHIESIQTGHRNDRNVVPCQHCGRTDHSRSSSLKCPCNKKIFGGCCSSCLIISSISRSI